MDSKPQESQAAQPVAATPLAFEKRMEADLGAAMDEAGKFFRGESDVHQSLRSICRRLDELGIPYAVAGGMAVSAHGLRRVTEDVDIIVERAGLQRIHEALEGLGYVRLFKESKNLRDVRTGVRIEFLITGGYPGDGRPKPIAFPAPADVVELHDGIKYINLPTLISLKLASGMSTKNRLKDLADVQELIKVGRIPRELAAELNPYVREKFLELWSDACESTVRFVRLWRPAVDDAKQLATMQADGLSVEPIEGRSDVVRLVTHDPTLARQHDLHEESEYWEAP